MPDAKKWVSKVKQADPPDLWSDALSRAEHIDVSPIPTRRHPLRAIALLAATLLVLGAVLYGLSGLGSSPIGEPLQSDQIVRYRLDGPPQPISVGEGAAWVSIGAGSPTTDGLVRIDADGGEQRSLEPPGGDWTAVGGGYAWVLCQAPACFDTSVNEMDPVTGEVLTGVAIRMDPSTGQVVGSTPLPGRGLQIVGTSEGVWVTTEEAVSFIDADGTITKTFDIKGPNLVGSDETSLWVSRAGEVVSLDPESGQVRAEVSFRDVCTMEVAAGVVWVASCQGQGDRLMGIDSGSAQVLFDEPIQGYGQMRYANGVLWLAQNDPKDEFTIGILGFAPRTGAPLGDPIEIARGKPRPGGGTLGMFPPHVFFAVGEGSFWLTDFSAFEVIRMAIPSGPVSSPTTAAAQDACALLTTAKIEDATGSAVISSGPAPGSSWKWAPPKPFRTCRYNTDGKFGILTVVAGPTGGEEVLAQVSPNPSEYGIDGLGDEAVVDGGMASVWVRVGDGYFSVGAQHGAGSEAVQMLTTLAREVLATTGTSSTTTSYADPLGWSIELPPGWTASHHAYAVNQGATFLGEVAGTQIGITIDHIAEGHVVTPPEEMYPHNDTALPLDPGQLEDGEGGPRMWFMTGGVSFRIQVGSRLTLEPDAQGIVDDMIRSITFEPWSVGERRGGYFALPWSTSEVEIGNPKVVLWGDRFWALGEADQAPSGAYEIEGPVPLCPDGSNGTVQIAGDHMATSLTCPDGTSVMWFGDGTPPSSNPPPYAQSLPKTPLIGTWDGRLLASVDSRLARP